MNKKILGSLFFVGGALLFTYLKFNRSPKKRKKEEQSILATVIEKKADIELYDVGLSSGIGHSYLAKFKTSDGRELELNMNEEEFNGLKMGMKGKLTFAGDKFIKFREIIEKKKAEEVVENVEVKKEGEGNYEVIQGLDKDEEREFMEDAGKIAEIGIVEDGLRVEKRKAAEKVTQSGRELTDEEAIELIKQSSMYSEVEESGLNVEIIEQDECKIYEEDNCIERELTDEEAMELIKMAEMKLTDAELKTEFDLKTLEQVADNMIVNNKENVIDE